MSEVKEEITQKHLEQWYTLSYKLKKIRDEEMLLRKQIFGHYFKDPKEGTNSFKLPDGYVLKGKHSINRSVDVAALDIMKGTLSEKGYLVDDLIEWKPSLVLSEYRELTLEEQNYFDAVLIIKDGSPALEVVQPKKKATAGTKK